MGLYLKSLRKSHAMTQNELSKILDCGQGSVSKYEEGTMELTAIEMIRICQFLNIPLESFVKCYIDSKKLVTSSLRKEFYQFKIPKKYSTNCIYNIRGVNPLIHFSKLKLTEEKFTEVIKNEMLIDPSYLMIMDGQVNSQFLDDLNSLTPFNQDDFMPFFSTFFRSNFNHGECHDDFQKSKNKLDAIRGYVKNSALYDIEYERTISHDLDGYMKIDYLSKNESSLEKLVKDYHYKFLELMGQYGDSSQEIVFKKNQGNGAFSLEVFSC